MRKLLAVLAMVALSSVVARAQDKGTEFKFGGEMREQFDYDANPSFLNSNQMSENNFEMRNQFHINAVSSDKLQAYVNMLHYSVWGAGVPSNVNPFATGNGGVQTTAGAVNSNNAVQINEAWMWWKTSDMFALRVGRQSLEYGDGLEFSKNDWLMNPYSVDALAGRFSWDFLDLDVGGGKLLDLGIPALAGGTAANTTDQEVDFYALYAGFKNLPEFLKKADVFVLQMNADNTGVPGYAPFAPSMSGATQWNLTSYGIHVKGDVSQLDYRVDAVLQSGKQKNGASAGNDVNFSTNMVDVEVGYSFPEFMKGRVYANYHMDSGQDQTQVSTSSYTNAQYQPLFYDQHTYGGLMDVFGWGNLTDIRFGLNLQPGEDTTVGVEANLFSRTQGNGSYTGEGNAYGNMFVLPTVGGGAAGQAAAGKNLGTEVDLWAKENYGHGLNVLAQLGYVSLGNYYNTAVNGGAPGSAYQFIAQVKYAF